MLSLRNIQPIKFFLAFGLTSVCFADTYVLPPAGQDIIGEIKQTQSTQKDTLLDIARNFGLGQNEILIANPGVDRWMPGDKTRIVIPSRFILPDAPRKGIVLNIPEMRLYYYTTIDQPKRSAVITHPISIGRMDWETPLGLTRIIAKQKDPSWRPPKSIKEEHAADGDILPDVVPPGPDNPLGRYAMRLSVPGYLIHSTNKPFGIGMQVTHGCVRMYPNDIEALFQMVSVNTPVHIVNQPIKIGWLMNTLYIEVSPALEDIPMSYDESLTLALDLIDKIRPSTSPRINGQSLRTALEERTGIPTAITYRSNDEATETHTRRYKEPQDVTYSDLSPH